MKISSKFTVAVHTLLCIYRFKKEYKVTSDFIAGSTGVNPVIIRRTLISLKAAGLVNVAAGTGGAELAVKPEDLTFTRLRAAWKKISLVFTSSRIPRALSEKISTTY